MPYTQEQLQAHIDETNFEVALETAAQVLDALTGEPIYGEPLALSLGRRYNYREGRWEDEAIRNYASAENAIEDGWVRCTYCEEFVHPNLSIDAVTIGDEVFCGHECAVDAGYHTCERCGGWYHEDDEVWTGDYGYCSIECANNDGFHRCDRCGDWTGEPQDVGDEIWCEHCADYYAVRCEDCENLIPERDAYYDDDEERWYCDSCYEERESHPHGVLHEYGYTPTLKFFTESGIWESEGKPPLFLGVELETDGGRNRRDYLNALAGLEGFNEHFWMTHDGSLENGVEITGHPMTTACHVGLMELYEGISTEATSRGFKSHDGGRCGLHIHVNRDWFGKDTRVQDAGGYKLMRLLQRFERQFIIFSRRTETGWCNYKTYGDYKLKDEVKISRNDKDEAGVIQMASRLKRNETSHSQCLNFQHRNTYEFRIFRGTLKWSTYFACLGLVNGMCHTVKHHGSTWVEDVSWYDLMAEVVERCDNDFARYCLESYLDEKGLR